MKRMTRSDYGGNIWRLFTAQALLPFILWVPIWVVSSRGGVIWLVAERRVATISR